MSLAWCCFNIKSLQICFSMFSQLRPMHQHKGSNISIIQTDPQLTVAAEYHRLATSRRRSKQQRIRVTSCVGSSLLQLLVLLLAVLGPPGELISSWDQQSPLQQHNHAEPQHCTHCIFVIFNNGIAPYAAAAVQLGWVRDSDCLAARPRQAPPHCEPKHSRCTNLAAPAW